MEGTFVSESYLSPTKKSKPKYFPNHHLNMEMPKIPVIKLGLEDLKGAGRGRRTCNEIRHALEEYGCFVAVYERISLELRNKVFNALEEMFNFPMETKIKNTSDTPFFGYFGQHPDLPLHESMGIGDVTTFQMIQNFSNLMWPNGNQTFW